jgi:hypothetical protein
MTPDYINELAKRAFTKISPDEWRQSEKISRYLREKPNSESALAQDLESQVPLQAEIAWHIGYTPSKWLLENELLEVQKRRDQHDIRSKGTQPPAAKIKDTEDDAHVRAADLGLMGLCFSGGGIRSATFNLGILQGLAELKLLTCFDYSRQILVVGPRSLVWLPLPFERFERCYTTPLNSARGAIRTKYKNLSCEAT